MKKLLRRLLRLQGVTLILALSSEEGAGLIGESILPERLDA